MGFRQDQIREMVNDIKDIEKITNIATLRREVENLIEEITDTQTSLDLLYKKYSSKVIKLMSLKNYKGWGEL